MRSVLSKRIPRDLKKNWLKYLGMLVILVCTIAVGSSYSTVTNGITKYLDDIVENNLQEDGFFEVTNKISNDDFLHFNEEKINVVENFYASENSYDGTAKVLLFNERKSIDLPTIFEGEMPKGSDEIALDHVFARTRDIQIGNSITLVSKTFKVVGTVALPDYTSLFLNNTDLVMNTKNFCVSILSEDGFNSIEEKFKTYRYSYRFVDRDLETKTKNTKAEEMMKYLYSTGNSVNSFLTADTNQSIFFLPTDIGTDAPTITAFVYILVGMIAFVFAILTNSSIEKEAVIIGTLRASGYTKGEIVWHYLQPTLIIAILGSILGNLLGYTAMVGTFSSFYYKSYSVGPIPILFNVPMFLLTTILPVVLMIGINTLMLFRKLRLTPLKFLRNELKSGKDRKARKLPNISFMKRFGLRVIGQNRGSYITLFTGIFLSSFLLLFGIGIRPLMDHYTEDVNNSLNYNYQYVLKAPTEVDGGEKLFVQEFKSYFDLGKKDIGVSCYGIKEDSTFFKDAYVKNGISISSSLANKMCLDVNDILKVKDSMTDKEYTFTINKVYDYKASMSIFMDQDSLLTTLEKEAGTYNCIVSNEELNIDQGCLIKKISRDDILGASGQLLDSFGAVLLIVNIFSVVIYLVMMYILTKVVIDKNALSISYMKVFGYEPKEIRSLFITPSTVVAFLSLIICLPLEALCFKWLLIFLSSMIDGYLDFFLPFWVYILILGIGAVTYGLITLLHLRSINRIPMTEALKNRE